MGELKSEFVRDDIETLIEATGYWEMAGNHEFYVMQLVRDLPLPPEDNEAHEIVTQLKDHYQKRSKEIESSRAVRQEKAVFLKAKLMLVRRDLGVSQLFDMASAVDTSAPPAAAAAGAAAAAAPEATATATVPASNDLELAEFFIRDLGVWNHYEKFLAERRQQKTAS